MTSRPSPRPIELRLVALGHRIAHRLSGGRVGSLAPGLQSPRGRMLAVITAVHLRLYRWTGGIIGDRGGGLDMLLLTTRGRKSGLPRTVPLPYFPHPEGVVVVASFAGGPRNPAWYENIVADGDVEVQIRRRRYRAVATAANAEERPAIWSSVLAIAPWYADYPKVTSREIPLVVLRAVS